MTYRKLVRNISLAAISLLIPFSVMAEQYQIRVSTTEKLSTWSYASPIYHPWVNLGGIYGCLAWSPTQSSVDYGVEFEQSRFCSQDQNRNVEIREKDSFSKTVKTKNVVIEERTLQQSESRMLTGNYRNWIAHTSTFTPWQDANGKKDYTSWLPVAISQTSNFNQERTYKQDRVRQEQEREMDTVTGDIRNKSGTITRLQTLTKTEQRPITVSWTQWTANIDIQDGNPYYNCSVWSPEINTIDDGTAFVQTQNCSMDEHRYRTYRHYTENVGKYNEDRVKAVSLTRNAVGTKPVYYWRSNGGPRMIYYTTIHSDEFVVNGVCTTPGETKRKVEYCTWNMGRNECRYYEYVCQ